MPNLTIRVDQTQANYENSFVYTIDVNFNGLEGNANDASVRIFFPSEIEVFEGYIASPIKSITKDPLLDGTLVIYEFNDIQDLGFAVRIGIGGRFKPDTPNGTVYSCTPEIWIAGEKVVSKSAETVTLSVAQNFQISQEIVLPVIDPTPGGIVCYKVTLENFGDKGTEINNLQMRISPSASITLDTTFIPIGYDKSEDRFIDNSQDGVTGIFNDGGFNLNLATYKGAKYEFFYRGMISPDAGIGTAMISSITLSSDEIPEKQVDHIVVLEQAIRSANTGILAPVYTLPDEPIRYAVVFMVDGNTDLYGVQFTHDIAVDVDYKLVKTGTVEYAGTGELVDGDYTIEYVTTKGIRDKLGTFNTTTNTIVSLEGIIPEDDNLERLVWNLPGLLVGMKQRESPTIEGVVKNPPDSSTLRYTYELSWLGGEVIKNYNTDIEDKCILTPVFTQSNYYLPVNPLGTLRYSMGLDCTQSRVSHPLVATLLPDTLTYVGNEVVEYTGFFGEDPPVVTPPLIAIQNFADTGRTLVKMTFDGDYNFHQGATINIMFDTTVKSYAQGMVNADMYLNTLDNNGVIPDGFDVYEDTLNIAEDENVSTDYAQSNSINNLILFFASVSADMKAKGEANESFIEEPQIAETYDGGNIQYKLSVTNTGTRPLTSIDIVDIFPHQGDTATILVDSTTGDLIERKSNFKIYSITDIDAKLIPEIPGQNPPQFQLLYSLSEDPVRFGDEFTTIGTDDDWSEDAPSDMTLVRAIRVKTIDTVLNPNQALEVSILATVPVDIQTDLVAWNSFSATATYLDLGAKTQQLIAIEPEKAGVKIVDIDPTKARIGGFVWIDTDGNGLFESDNIGEDGIGIILYDESGRPLAATFTEPNNNGEPGYYRFNNLEPGKYFIRAVIETNKYKFTKQVLDMPNGNKVNTFGFTPYIEVMARSESLNQHAGIVHINRMDTILKINESARKMVRNVTYNQMLIGMKYEDVKDLLNE